MNTINYKLPSWFNKFPTVITAKVFHNEGFTLIDTQNDFIHLNRADTRDIIEMDEDLINYDDCDDCENITDAVKQDYKVIKTYGTTEDRDQLLEDDGFTISDLYVDRNIVDCDNNVTYIVLQKIKPEVIVSKEKMERLAKANEFIKHIAETGREFYSSKTNGNPDKFISSFYYDRFGDIWFIDYYSKHHINVSDKNCHWNGFTSGGTLQNFTSFLGDFIENGSTLNPSYFTMPEYRSGHVWGYPEKDIKLLQEKAIELGIVNI